MEHSLCFKKIFKKKVENLEADLEPIHFQADSIQPSDIDGGSKGSGQSLHWVKSESEHVLLANLV